MTTHLATAATAAPVVTSVNAVLRVPPATPADAAAYFTASLAFHTDVSDVAAALEAAQAGTDPGFVLVDTRSTEAWDQGHIPGAVHLPTAQIPQLAGTFLDRSVPVVVHCWGPGCNGAVRAAAALAGLGYQVKEMLGGIEYWIREGFGYETAEGPGRRDTDGLTAPLGAAACGC
ncbi:rhodanese-like domain-containing protein [Streptomyces cocklensis]|uniref:Rhodanese-related sulfurtransferase n=1 Tax=Actinacidiphila cocklensis TaxID=887465 RepID=A0A9W4EA80_9ACTN|nr:rhodanese-like domain-containing protein [Actinacidiphila cocklensis]MDD1059773.1 rhodanese-like domain-containing protein [Actinacidiphila cocklensis]CAG6397048.1 Rhodanese-related sulfurtransferase [Actinacidiphila cocklensis]